MKKGFTLIELLAVIVILAIIALIATPIILNIIDSTKDKSEELSKELYLRAVDQAIATRNLKEEFNPTRCEVNDSGNLNCILGENQVELAVEVNGSRPCGGNIILTNGKVESESLEFGKCLYKDKSGANAPELVNGLTPVKYNGNNWVIADTSKEWYDYESQEWANAVILSESGKSKKAGDALTLPTSKDDAANSDVVAMFVWIPRYSYTISTESKGVKDSCKGSNYNWDCYLNPGTIDIKFIDVNTKDDGSATYTDSIEDTWYTHPAFTFGEEELRGIWVGKFETTGSDTETTILPNVTPLVSVQIKDQFEAALKFNTDLQISGESHMMKNSEWGAVAYLSQSSYGKYGNSDFLENEKEIYINNSGEFLGGYTGRSGGAPGGKVSALKDQYPDSVSTSTSQYNDYGYYTYDGYKVNYDGSISTERELKKGTGASTTGNIYGIYDMSGGVEEYVMASTNGEISSSGFSEMPDPKYYDVYSSSSFTSCGDECKGHALDETSGWYSDFAGSPTVSWFRRGGAYNSNNLNAGIFSFSFANGIVLGIVDFRIVITNS